MLEILAGSNLTHRAVLVSIDTGECGDVIEQILQAVSKLEGIDGTETELNVRIDDKLHDTAQLAHQVEGVTETTLLSLFGCERLGWLEVHVVVEGR